MQSFIYGRVADQWTAGSLVQLLCRRIRLNFKTEWLPCEDVLKSSFTRSCTMLSGFRQNDAMHVLRCWLNALTTSCRMHGAEDTLSCRFGCENMKDEMSHYMRCPLLLRCCVSKFNEFELWAESHSERVSFCTLWQIGTTSRFGLLRLAAVCHAYHACMNSPSTLRGCEWLEIFTRIFNERSLHSDPHKLWLLWLHDAASFNDY